MPNSMGHDAASRRRCAQVQHAETRPLTIMELDFCLFESSVVEFHTWHSLFRRYMHVAEVHLLTSPHFAIATCALLRVMMASSSGLNERAQTGFAKSDAYDQHRPAYSPSVVQLLLENLGVSGKHGAKILDLAAGTGKFTEALAGRDEQYEIVAVEPHADMRRVLDEKKLPRVTVEEGKADGIPLGRESVDAVVCAQVGTSLYYFLVPVSYCSFPPTLRRKDSS